MMSADPVVDLLEQLRAEVQERTDRVAALRKLRSYPYVTPVLIEYRHHVQYENDLSSFWNDDDPLYTAFVQLAYGIEAGTSSPQGVRVNGVMLTFDELEQRFGKRWDEVTG